MFPKVPLMVGFGGKGQSAMEWILDLVLLPIQKRVECWVGTTDFESKAQI